VLSGGQRQRIGLARAVYNDPKLILLDEPNSNLDEQGEVALAKALKELKEKGATVIVITHRPGVLGALDNILIMKGGKMATVGPREDVLKALQKNIAAPKPVRKSVVPITVPPIS